LKIIEDFSFDDRVAKVFGDMIARSVPGYSQILHLIPTLVRSFKQTNNRYYDLGCSLGAGMMAIAEGLQDQQSAIIGVDNSIAMLEQAKPVLEQYNQTKDFTFELQHADVNHYVLLPAAMILMNFTLQFIPLEQRGTLIGRIYAALEPGGVLVLSEKIKFEDAAINQSLTEIHHQYKADQGYSQLEISQKRDAIENVLLPEPLDSHVKRLQQAGFGTTTPWIQNLQFMSIIAIK
jgi:tRNA (cmo5U34)-methyltransferase